MPSLLVFAPRELVTSPLKYEDLAASFLENLLLSCSMAVWAVNRMLHRTISVLLKSPACVRQFFENSFLFGRVVMLWTAKRMLRRAISTGLHALK